MSLTILVILRHHKLGSERGRDEGGQRCVLVISDHVDSYTKDEKGGGPVSSYRGPPRSTDVKNRMGTNGQRFKVRSHRLGSGIGTLYLRWNLHRTTFMTPGPTGTGPGKYQVFQFQDSVLSGQLFWTPITTGSLVRESRISSQH